MCVCEKYEVDVSGSNGYLDVLEDVLALFHTEINEEFLSAGFDICAASGDLVGRTYKHHFHR